MAEIGGPRLVFSLETKLSGQLPAVSGVAGGGWHGQQLPAAISGQMPATVGRSPGTIADPPTTCVVLGRVLYL